MKIYVVTVYRVQADGEWVAGCIGLRTSASDAVNAAALWARLHSDVELPADDFDASTEYFDKVSGREGCRIELIELDDPTLRWTLDDKITEEDIDNIVIRNYASKRR